MTIQAKAHAATTSKTIYSGKDFQIRIEVDANMAYQLIVEDNDNVRGCSVYEQIRHDNLQEILGTLGKLVLEKFDRETATRRALDENIALLDGLLKDFRQDHVEIKSRKI